MTIQKVELKEKDDWWGSWIVLEEWKALDLRKDWEWVEGYLLDSAVMVQTKGQGYHQILFQYLVLDLPIKIANCSTIDSIRLPLAKTVQLTHYWTLLTNKEPRRDIIGWMRQNLLDRNQ